ncbi:MAG: hypothetical protein ABSB33_02235 [Tepidisphaeraceae bacterium]|jgi:hypothetical protein
MSCLIARADETLDEPLFRSARGSESRRSFQAGSLFELSVKPIRPARFEPRIRREEDAERWDGLS